MASKRPAPDIHPSRREQVPNEPRPAKRQKPDNLGHKSYKKAHPTNNIKTTIRSLKRLLEKKEDLPPKIRIEKERALASAQHDLDEEQSADKRSKMIARYHKVRFFDRQKATKRLKRSRKALRVAEGPAERAVWGKRVDEAEVDVSYAIYYPLDVPYVALFPTKRKVEGEEGVEDSADAVSDSAKELDERQGDPKMRELVKKCLAKGNMLDKLKNGKLDENGEFKNSGQRLEREFKQKKPETKEPRNPKRKAAEMEAEESEAESDGGFFE